MSQIVEGGRPIGRFRVFGFPVTIDISFLVIVALLGWYPGVSARDYVVWLALVPLAVLVHELGHAFVARTTGADPSIALVGLGGLTSYLPPVPLSRARSVAISVAGPAVGIVIGLALLVARGSVEVAPGGLGEVVLRLAVFTTLGWSLLNLLPILPLDGGQILRELLPGAPARREVLAAYVSVVVALIAAVFAYRAGLVFGAVMALFFIASNVMTIRASRELEKVDINRRLVGLLWTGRGADAHDLLTEQPPDTSVHPLVRAAVRAVGEGGGAGQGEAGRDEGLRELEAAAAGAPHAADPVNLLLLVHVSRGDWTAAVDLVCGPRGRVVDVAAVSAAQAVAFRAGAVRESAALGEALLDRTDRFADAVCGSGGDKARALIAFNASCGWAAAGEPERGLAAFRRAADLGFDDLTAVDGDDDIAPLRPLPGYDEARAAIRRRALDRADRDEDRSTSA